MGRLLSRIAKRLTTCSNRRSSHAHTNCTQFSEVMRIFRHNKPQSLQATTAAHAQSGRCAPGLRRREDFSCPPAAVHRSSRRFQHGRFSAHQPLAGNRGAERLAPPSGELGCGTGRTSGPAQSPFPQHRQLVRRERQGYPPSGTGGLVSRPQREYPKQTGLQERLLLSGSQPAHRKDRCHRRPAAVPAGQNRAAAQPSPQIRSTHSLSQQEQSGPQHFGSFAPSAAQRLGCLRPVRQLVCFGAVDQICPPPRLARDLRSQTQPQAQWPTHRSDRFRSQAQAVPACTGRRCGREPNHLLCAPDHRSLAEGSLRRPRLLLETAPQGAIPGVPLFVSFETLSE